MYTQPEAHAVSRLVPSYCYQYIYPPDDFDLNRVSYFFDHDQGDILNRVDYEAIYALVGAWKQRWQQRPLPSLKYFKAWKSIRIEDARYGAVRQSTYTDRAAQLYEFCNDARNFQSIVETFDHDTAWVEDTLGHFVEQDLIISLDDRYLSLALPANTQL